jgi:hypothetical protein
MKRGRRSGLAVSAASAMCLVAAFAGTAMASPAGGVKGDPQPELTPFKLGVLKASSPGGGIAMEPDGGLVAAYDIGVGSGRLQVCVLSRGGHGCASKTELSPPSSSDDTSGAPGVFIPSANHVIVLQATCCDGSADGGDVLFSSTNGGKTFGPAVRVGSLSVDASALIGGQIVFGQGGHDGAQVESIPVSASGPPAVTATPISKTSYEFSIGSYRSGALIASQSDGAAFDTTYVDYAASGSDFNATSSYHQVGAISKEGLIGMAGDALLTIQTGGKETAELRLFNGRGFGPAHAVPGTSGGEPEWFTVNQDPSGAVHVFADRAAQGYDLIEHTSTDGGARWQAPVNLGNAIDSDYYNAALDSHGAGLVLGTDQAEAYPVLAAQGVSFSIKSSSIRKGKSATASGKISPAAVGRLITLQVQGSGGKWFDVTHATAHTKSGGSFSFTIKGSAAGSFRYRAVASDLAGYLMYGYSNAKSLRVTG